MERETTNKSESGRSHKLNSTDDNKLLFTKDVGNPEKDRLPVPRHNGFIIRTPHILMVAKISLSASYHGDRLSRVDPLLTKKNRKMGIRQHASNLPPRPGVILPRVDQAIDVLQRDRSERL